MENKEWKYRTEWVNNINAFLVTDKQRNLFFDFGSCNTRYVDGKKFGLKNDMLCYDCQYGSYIIVRIEDLI